MDDYRNLARTKWKCQYHVVCIPRYRRKVLYGTLRNELGDVFHELARHKESTIEHGLCCPDHVHMLIWIPPKFAVSSVIGYVKGKSAIHVARQVTLQPSCKIYLTGNVRRIYFLDLRSRRSDSHDDPYQSYTIPFPSIDRQQNVNTTRKRKKIVFPSSAL